MPRLKTWQIVALLLAGAMLLGVTPLTVYNATLLMLGNSFGWAWATVRSVPVPPSPLKAAILNVTTDFDQLTHLVADFLRQPGMDPAIEQQFKVYLSNRATRSYPRLESTLDWLLAIYKFVFPFLIISMVAKLSSQESSAEAAAGAGEEDAEADRGAQPDFQRQLSSRRSSQQQQDALLPAAPSSGGGSGALQQRRHLAIGNGDSRAGKGGGGGGGSSGAADRGGSQSPRGPATPMERFLPQVPAQTTTAAPGAKGRQRAAIHDIQADGF